MRRLALPFLVLAACPADDTGVDVDNAILLGDAADSVLVTISEAPPEINDDKAAALVAPEPGAALPRDTPPQFAWSTSGFKARSRGSVSSGEFVWLQLYGGGLAREIDVLAVGVTTWTPTAAEWAEISAATGPVTLVLTNAALDNGALTDGPYRGTAASTFSIAP